VKDIFTVYLTTSVTKRSNTTNERLLLNLLKLQEQMRLPVTKIQNTTKEHLLFHLANFLEHLTRLLKRTVK